MHDHQKARTACRYWRESGKKGEKAGCDQAILLGNDPLYGGLGGEFTCVISSLSSWVCLRLTVRVITASELNGPLVLRHELGHSLIDVGEEYEGGELDQRICSTNTPLTPRLLLLWRQQRQAVASVLPQVGRPPLIPIRRPDRGRPNGTAGVPMAQPLQLLMEAHLHPPAAGIIPLGAVCGFSILDPVSAARRHLDRRHLCRSGRCIPGWQVGREQRSAVARLAAGFRLSGSSCG